MKGRELTRTQLIIIYLGEVESMKAMF